MVGSQQAISQGLSHAQTSAHCSWKNEALKTQSSVTKRNSRSLKWTGGHCSKGKENTGLRTKSLRTLESLSSSDPTEPQMSCAEIVTQ